MPRCPLAMLAAFFVVLAGSDGLNPGLTPRNLGPGANCRPGCATSCDRLSCQGLNVSQCQSLRFSCRNACRSRC